MFQSPYIFEGSQGKYWSKVHVGTYLLICSSGTSSATFPDTSQDPLPRASTTQVGWTVSHQSLIRNMPLQICLQASQVEAFYQLKFPLRFSDDCSLSQADTDTHRKEVSRKHAYYKAYLLVTKNWNWIDRCWRRPLVCPSFREPK